MHTLIQSRIRQIADLCRERGVKRLSLFGSAAGSEFDPNRSDVDLLVEFYPATPAQHARNYLSLAEDLESLLGLRVDLVEPGPIRNPYLRRSIENTKIALYDAA